MMLLAILSLLAVNYAHSFSVPSSGFVKIKSRNEVAEPPSSSSGFVKIKSWNEVAEPPSSQGKPGRRYGPNWSVDEHIEPKLVEGEAGAMVWAIGNSSYVHPEMRSDFPVGKWLRSRPNLGICMSGGGMRAATCALGWYRALNHLGLLQKTRYIGANSGATWTTLPLFCRQMLQMKEKRTKIDLDEYLGKYEKDLVLDDRKELGIIGENLIKANVMRYTENAENTSFNDWCDSIEQNYVDPIMEAHGGVKDGWKQDFWLDLSNAYLWNTNADKNILGDHSFPFPIFVATAYQTTNSKEFVPIENTPLYSGIPVDPRKLGVKTDIGGGFVQGVALNADGMKNTDPVPIDSDNLYLKEFTNPSPVVKMAELTGASSNFGASADAMIKLDLQNPRIAKLLYNVGKIFKKEFRQSDLSGYVEPGKYEWWSPTTGGDPVELEFVDGGMFDNLGVLSVLRRGCSTVIVCDANDGDVVDTEEEDVPSKFYDVAALFGKSEPFLDKWLLKEGYKDTVNERSQVFKSEEFDWLMDEMRKLRKAKKPLVVRKTLELQKNEFAGIYEKREVDMIFCFNGVVEEFLGTVEESDKDEDNFPYIDTTKCNYNIQEVHMLTSLACYNLVEGLKNVNFDISQVEK